MQRVSTVAADRAEVRRRTSGRGEIRNPLAEIRNPTRCGGATARRETETRHAALARQRGEKKAEIRTNAKNLRLF